MTFVLVHSPLVGPSTWEPVADALRARGEEAVVPDLADDGTPPFWRQHVRAAAASVGEGSVLAAHSGAGMLVAAIRELAGVPVSAYLFVDAVLPEPRSRLAVIEREGGDWAAEFRAHLAAGGTYPTWTADELADVIPDATVREQLTADLRPRAMPFWTEQIPVFEEWPDAPCAFLQWSETYHRAAADAKRRGWEVVRRTAGHFELLANPDAVAADLIALRDRIRS